ncbi:MAG: DUF1761 domain-containing protein [Pseudomonadota bacterium]
MIYILINFWQILAATVAGFAFAVVYYAGLSNPWRRAARLSAEEAKASPATLAISFAAEFWIASILAGAIILAPEEAGAWTMAIGTAVVIWIGFVMPTMLVNHRYQKAPALLTAIDGGHWLGVMVLQVCVLQALSLTPPPGG